MQTYRGVTLLLDFWEDPVGRVLNMYPRMGKWILQNLVLTILWNLKWGTIWDSGDGKIWFEIFTLPQLVSVVQQAKVHPAMCSKVIVPDLKSQEPRRCCCCRLYSLSCSVLVHLVGRNPLFKRPPVPTDILTKLTLLIFPGINIANLPEFSLSSEGLMLTRLRRLVEGGKAHFS